jgi:hypothetical protein
MIYAKSVLPLSAIFEAWQVLKLMKKGTVARFFIAIDKSIHHFCQVPDSALNSLLASSI